MHFDKFDYRRQPTPLVFKKERQEHRSSLRAHAKKDAEGAHRSGRRGTSARRRAARAPRRAGCGERADFYIMKSERVPEFGMRSVARMHLPRSSFRNCTYPYISITIIAANILFAFHPLDLARCFSRQDMCLHTTTYMTES